MDGSVPAAERHLSSKFKSTAVEKDKKDMLTAGDFKNGITIEYDGKICQVVEFQHVKPGKGAAFVRTKLKNIKDGGVVETSFRPTEKFENAHIDRKDMTYLYNDGDLYYFMDDETFDLVPLNGDLVQDALNFIKEGDKCDIAFYKGKCCVFVFAGV